MSLALLALLGGLLALDGTSVGQVMVSRPLVAGVLVGWVLGDPFMGLLIGGTLEIYFISVFPVGGSEFPEGGPPALVAVATGIAVPETAGIAAGVALGVLVGFVWSRLGSGSVRLLRQLNGRLAPDPSRRVVSRNRIVWAHLAGIGMDFARGALLSAGGLAFGTWLARTIGDLWPLGMPATLGILVVGASLPAGAFVRSMGGWRRRAVFFVTGVLGFLVGSVLL
jgi:mannose/fructose/N-acetylgalactosamine-specific phosphotransferase system component IIC